MLKYLHASTVLRFFYLLCGSLIWFESVLMISLCIQKMVNLPNFYSGYLKNEKKIFFFKFIIGTFDLSNLVKICYCLQNFTLWNCEISRNSKTSIRTSQSVSKFHNTSTKSYHAFCKNMTAKTCSFNPRLIKSRKILLER